MRDGLLYTEDILKNGFEQTTLRLKDDSQGEVTATLIRRKSAMETNKAVLYVHGFNDYFFQTEMASRFNEHEFNFYALDLRKYGRSYLPHQRFNDSKDLRDYYEEILMALKIIHKEGNSRVTLVGHSTGGLILSIFAKDHMNGELFNGLILNSPFFEFNKSWLVRKMIPLAAFFGGFMPQVKVAGGFSEEYGKSLHKDFSGEWDYNLQWKPNIPPKVNLGWIRAIYLAQKRFKRYTHISKPVLTLHSETSISDTKDMKKLQSNDAILNVKEIHRIARFIEGDTFVQSIKGGMHDLVLSPEPAREATYKAIFEFVDRYRL